MTIPIESLLSLGPGSSRWLCDAGITTIADLEQIGPIAAYQLVKQRQPKACLNLLLALEPGLKEQDWRELPEVIKQRLRKEAEKE